VTAFRQFSREGRGGAQKLQRLKRAKTEESYYMEAHQVTKNAYVTRNASNGTIRNPYGQPAV